MSEHPALNVGLVVRPRRVALVLGGVAVTLVMISVVLSEAKLLFDSDRLEWVVDLFRLNREANIPSFFSGLLFLLAAALLVAVWRTRQGAGRWAWLLLATLFTFLSYDEFFSVHERLIDPLREALDLSGVLYFAWIPVYAVAVLAVGGLFWGVWRRLGRQHRFWFAAAATTYLIGAVGFEMLGGARYSGEEGDLVYGLLYTIEESLEMAGLILFIYALLALLAELDPPVSLQIESRSRAS
jgi:hypothetical protein